jgi:mannose-6-phosphate isomerase-like protein (cupin superfamily)
MKPGERRAIAVPAGAGRTLMRPDTVGAVTIKLSSDESDGAITVWETRRPPGDSRGPSLHCHPGFDEMFYVLAGEYAFTAGDEKFLAPEGAFLFVPRGIFHSVAISGEAEGRLLSFVVPGDIEDSLITD